MIVEEDQRSFERGNYKFYCNRWCPEDKSKLDKIDLLSVQRLSYSFSYYYETRHGVDPSDFCGFVNVCRRHPCHCQFVCYIYGFS